MPSQPAALERSKREAFRSISRARKGVSRSDHKSLAILRVQSPAGMRMSSGRMVEIGRDCKSQRVPSWSSAHSMS